jgi:hypothetical protein
MAGSWLRGRRKRGRVLAWLAWPALVFLVTISVIHFLRYRLGWDLYWSWAPIPTAVALVVALAVPVAYELSARRQR